MSNDDVITTGSSEKPKSNRRRLLIIIAGVVVTFCCGILALGSYLANTPEGQARATERAEEQQVTRAEETAIASVEETEAARPTSTVLPTNTAAPTDTSAPTHTPQPTNTPIPSSTPVPTDTPNPNLIRPGTYIVGTDIEPGIYQGIAGDDLFDSCYWARLKDLTGNFEALLANDNSIGQFYVEILESDYAFETACEVVLLASLPDSTGVFPSQIFPGTYIVGRDIQPGTYRGQAGEDILESCYWARLRDVSGDFAALITNDNSTGQYYIEVLPTDFALTTGCELELLEN